MAQCCLSTMAITFSLHSSLPVAVPHRYWSPFALASFLKQSIHLSVVVPSVLSFHLQPLRYSCLSFLFYLLHMSWTLQVSPYNSVSVLFDSTSSEFRHAMNFRSCLSSNPVILHHSYPSLVLFCRRQCLQSCKVNRLNRCTYDVFCL